ncbi:MAG TPA: hypothetical protein VFC19_53395 [Candidatus Limnocylindrales bacterium]|nr:hypothetical protein [Candidatus Limnocylindrales bacterium]
MGSSRLFVDPLALRVFNHTLQARLDEALAALNMIQSGPRLLGPDPALGEFDDALRTSLRHNQLRQDYLDRLRRLVSALETARSVTESMIEKFAKAEEVNVAQMRRLLHRVEEALEHGQRGVADG